MHLLQHLGRQLIGEIVVPVAVAVEEGAQRAGCAYAAGQFEALALRGGFVLLVSAQKPGALGGGCMVVDYYCRLQKKRVRSTYTGELYNML